MLYLFVSESHEFRRKKWLREHRTPLSHNARNFKGFDTSI
jgi:hypothetical protein